MKELSLNILDIAKNSVRAEATKIEISILEDENGIMTLRITDDGCGMDEATIKAVSDPFFTSRKTRKVGLGIPFLILASTQAEGNVKIESKTVKDSPLEHGTVVTATFNTKNIDFTPLGNIVESLMTLIQGNPEINYLFEHKTPATEVRLSTEELKEVLGDISLAEPEIILWMTEYLEEQYRNSQ